MTTVKEIYKYIDSFAPFDSAEPWDNVGILIGSESAPVQKALAALDITNDVIDEAVKMGAELIISHHPIIFGGIKKVMKGSPVFEAAAAGVNCICAHTNLDKSPIFGVNTALAEAAGLVGCAPSQNDPILFIAQTAEPMTPEAFAEQIKKNLGLPSIGFTSCGTAVSKVGLCSGAGGSEIFAAAAEGCDAFLTGEIKHHEILAANSAGISTFILGHYGSEDVVIEPLAQRLSKQFTEVSFAVSKTFTDGVRFL